MLLNKLLKNIVVLKKFNFDESLHVSGIVDDNRKAFKDCAFVAIKGINIDSHKYISAAISSGARVIFYEHRIEEALTTLNKNCVFIQTANSRKTLAILASNWFNNPSEKMKIVGITGTNGKTTTSTLVYQMLSLNGMRAGLVTSVEAKIGDKSYDTGFHVTNPEPLQLHEFLSKMVESKCEIAILEITSHGIDQFRHYGIDFDVAAITNITPEHLDYHKTFKNYMKTKASLLSVARTAIVNINQPHIEDLYKYLPTDYIPVDITNYDIPVEFSEQFPGEYNLYNASVAWEICRSLGLSDEKIASALKKVEKVKGRFEYANKADFDVIVDFAHDAAALENVLKVGRKLTKGKLISVFGCAGLRDFKKRPAMGKVAKQIADIVIITAEDPRTEILEEINKSIEQGVLDAGGIKDETFFIIEDRQQAIDFAINKLAKSGDVLLITGKGHENSMCFGTTEYPWSDFDAVERALNKR